MPSAAASHGTRILIVYRLGDRDHELTLRDIVEFGSVYEDDTEDLVGQLREGAMFCSGHRMQY